MFWVWGVWWSGKLFLPLHSQTSRSVFVFPSADAQDKVFRGFFSPMFCGKGNFLYLCKTNAKKLALIEEVIDIMNKGIAPIY